MVRLLTLNLQEYLLYAVIITWICAELPTFETATLVIAALQHPLFYCLNRDFIWLNPAKVLTNCVLLRYPYIRWLIFRRVNALHTALSAVFLVVWHHKLSLISVLFTLFYFHFGIVLIPSRCCYLYSVCLFVWFL